jgi:hypothetical protein
VSHSLRNVAAVTFGIVLVLLTTIGVAGADGSMLRHRHDSQPPSAPTGLRVDDITQTSGRLAWTRSTDNVGVAGYQVYVDGHLLATTPP